MTEEEKVDQILKIGEWRIARQQEKTASCLALTNYVSSLKAMPENQPPYQLNLLDIGATDEPMTSQILSLILQYRHQGRFPLLESFFDRFLTRIGMSARDIRHARIAAEADHIDVRVLDDTYALIIENKIKNAVYQRNQLGRYIERVHTKFGYPYDRIFIVLLPQFVEDKYVEGICKSAWCCPADWESSNADRACCVNDQYQCWCDEEGWNYTEEQRRHCSRCKTDFRDLFTGRTTVVGNDFADWLQDAAESLPMKEIILKSALYQFSDYAKGLYQTKTNNNIIMQLTDQIEKTVLAGIDSNCEKWKELNERIANLPDIQKAMQNMRLALSKDLIDEWYHELKDEWPDLRREVHKSFGMLIRGVWVGCWCGSDNGGSPYWGFWCEGDGTEEQKAMVSAILVECDIAAPERSKNFIAWSSTLHGADRCRAFYRAAQKLLLTYDC